MKKQSPTSLMVNSFKNDKWKPIQISHLIQSFVNKINTNYKIIVEFI